MFATCATPLPRAIPTSRPFFSDLREASATKCSSHPPPAKVPMRWLQPRALPEVVAIEASSFEFPCSEEELIRCLRQRNCAGIVAENSLCQTIGFVVYALHHARLQVLSLAVHPIVRHCKVGTQLIDKLKSQLSLQHRDRVVVEVRETNLFGQRTGQSR